MALYDKASLVLIPSGTKAGTVYSQKPTSGDGDFDFTRSTYATRVNSQGLIEKERSNLLLQSNNFDTTWTVSGAPPPTGGQTGYDGSSDAWLLTKTGPAGRIIQSISVSGVNTISAYVKANVSDWAVLEINGVGFSYFDLQNGVVGSGNSVVATSIESVGNGWYRCSYTGNGTGINGVIYVGDSNGSISGTSGSIYIQDAQLEQGLVATDYIETTTSAVYTGITDNVPRLDYDGDCPSLLLEPSRHNVLAHSEFFGIGSGYVNLGNRLTIEPNTSDTLSPEGKYNAVKLTAALSGGKGIRLLGLTQGTPYVFTVWAKAGNYDGLAMDISDETQFPYTLTNEWQRYEVTTSSSEGNFADITFQSDAGIGDYFYIYGAQVEEGSYATSYIPTYGTSVTRNKDEALQNSSYTFGSGAFSLFFEHEPIPVGSNGQVMLLKVNPLDFYFRYLNDSGINIWNQDIQQTVLNKTMSRNANHKVCMVYDGIGSTDIYIDGVKERDGYSFTWPDGPYNIGLDSTAVVSGDIPIHISQVMTFETALTNEEAIALTTV